MREISLFWFLTLWLDGSAGMPAVPATILMSGDSLPTVPTFKKTDLLVLTMFVTYEIGCVEE